MNKIYFLLLLLLVGCQSTSGDSRFSPTATNVRVEKVAVFVPNDTRTENNIVEGINAQGTDAASMKRVLEFINDDSEIQDTLNAYGITHVLVVSGKIGQENIRYAGSISNSNTNVNAWSTAGTINATANTNSYSTPIYSANNYANVNGKLFRTDGQLIWVTDVELEAQGTLYTGAKAMSEGVAKGLVDEMKKSGLLANK
jgi:hypothetical protein